MKVFSLLVSGVVAMSQKVEVNGLIKDVTNTDHLFNPISVTDKKTLNYYHLARAFKLEHDTSVVLCVRGSKNYQVVEEWNHPLPSDEVVKVKMFQVGKKYEFQFEDDACPGVVHLLSMGKDLTKFGYIYTDIGNGDEYPQIVTVPTSTFLTRAIVPLMVGRISKL